MSYVVNLDTYRLPVEVVGFIETGAVGGCSVRHDRLPVEVVGFIETR